MKKLTDKELIKEIEKRFEEKNANLKRLMAVTEELEKVNKRLLDSERIKSRFLSNIRNEVNNPLAAIIAFSQNIIKLNESDIDKIRQAAEFIYSEACALDFQLTNIFTAAELEGGELRVRVSSFPPLEFVKNLIAYVDDKRICEKKRIEFQTNIQKNSVFSTDKEKLHLILTNLISNAAKFSTEKEKIIISLSLNNETLCISVKDNGIGVKENLKEEIFERFFQADSGICKAYRGHGLGLSIVKSLVEMLEGKISVEPAKQGSVFTVSLPNKTDSEYENDVSQNFFSDESEFSDEGGVELF